MGVEGSETWHAVLDAAEAIMRDKGYAAVTSRQIGAEAGLSPQIAYFYFSNMDELFEALFKRLADGMFAALEEVRTKEQPLLALWQFSCNPSKAVLMSEIVSLSNHRKNLQSLIGEFGVEYHRRQAEIIEAELKPRGADLGKWPPVVIAAILENLAKGLAFGEGFQIESHTLARDAVTSFLQELMAKA